MKDLLSIDGTIANVMNERINEVDFNHMTLSEMKEAILNILADPRIKQKDLAKKYMYEVSTKTNVSHLVSTVGTYLTGIQLGKTRNYSRKYS